VTIKKKKWITGGSHSVLARKPTRGIEVIRKNRQTARRKKIEKWEVVRNTKIIATAEEHRNLLKKA